MPGRTARTRPEAREPLRPGDRQRHSARCVGWCGETHLQKATFLLEDGCDVPLDFDSVLYKYGPFSFDLHDELEDLRAQGFIRLEPQAYPYGPRIAVTERGQHLLERHPKTLRHSQASWITSPDSSAPEGFQRSNVWPPPCTS